jgi:hypothetical protein
MAGDDADAGPFSLIGRLRRSDSLQWFAELGIGYYPVVKRHVYNADYFAKYQGYATTALGQKLNALRLAMVRRHHEGQIVDVGIGCGSFIEAHGNAHGYDISPTAIRWLVARNLFRDPYRANVGVVTMWDSIEHIEDFPYLLSSINRFVFISTPIFDGLDHVLRSRHYRKDEHFWYFTRDGLTLLMARLGWCLVESNDMETSAGRDRIGSFAFARS